MCATIMNDGTKITWARNLDHFARLTASKTPAWIYSEDGSEILYNPYVDFTKLCPADYRVPTPDDWSQLRETTCPNGDEEEGSNTLVNGQFGARLVGFVFENNTTDHAYVDKGKTALWWSDIAGDGTTVIFIVNRESERSRVGYYYNGESVGHGLRLIQIQRA